MTTFEATMKNYQETYGDLLTEQLLLEEEFKRIGQAKLQKTLDRYTTDENASMTELSIGQHFLSHEFSYVKQAIKDFIIACVTPKPGSKPTYFDLIYLINDTFPDKEQMYDMLTLTTFSNMFSLAIRNKENSQLAQLIGDEIFYETRLQAYVNSHPDRAMKTFEGIDKRVQALYRNAYVKACLNKDKFVFPKWATLEVVQLGAALIQVVLRASSYFEDTTNVGNYKIMPTQKLLDAWQHNIEYAMANAFTFCPTIIPPRPWESFKNGGYYGELIGKATLLRTAYTRHSHTKAYLNRLDQLTLNKVRQAVNSIQATPWKIHKEVLEVAQAIKRLGGGQAGIPAIDPPKPAVLSENPTETELQDYKKKMVAFYRTEHRRRSHLLRVDANLTVATRFKQYDRFYIPCNMDFRGRVYPIPSFNFQGDDLNKGLLMFADAPAITDEIAEKWFRVAGANFAGVDKVSFDDRLKWVADNEQNILNSADDPLGYKWWMNQDCPFQFLQFCFEYRKLIEWKKQHGTIVGWQTGMIIAFDGTCSGLQHFSAILRDPVGAAAVNLLPSDKPSDIYGIVAQKVNKVLDEDVLRGSDDEQATDKQGNQYTKYGTKTLALIWKTYGVTRKVTKRSVMTLAYGSKEYGFKEQILEDTIKKDLDENGESSVFYGCQAQCAKYLAKLIWDAVNTTVVAAVKGMKWLQECAKMVCKNGKVVTWMTPAGLPVQQQYLKFEMRTVQVRCAGRRLRLYFPESKGEIDDRHQVSGIAPNFIHSMDASHLQLSVCACNDQGLQHFSMVHDSYGTCLAHANTMFNIIREEFIKMYTEQDVFENFKADLQELVNKPLPPLPKKYDLDLNKIRESQYVFC